MLRGLARTTKQNAVPLYRQTRDIRLFEIFSKEKTKERRAQLKEEMQHGYFDDFRKLRDTNGKIFPASEQLIPAPSAPMLPGLQVVRPDGSQTGLREEARAARLTLLDVAFKEGARDMIASWNGPFERQYDSRDDVQILELSVVESWVMRQWPFRSLILRSGAREGQSDMMGLRHRYLFHFGDAKPLCDALQLTNRLTGYVFLVDAEGRARWRASGYATPRELQLLLLNAQKLLKDETNSPNPNFE